MTSDHILLIVTALGLLIAIVISLHAQHKRMGVTDTEKKNEQP